MCFPRWRALRAKLIALQNKAVGTNAYRSQEWDEVMGEAEKIAREGVGEPDHAGPEDITVRVRPSSPSVPEPAAAPEPETPEPEPASS
jgi:hypothetical protein